MFLNLYQILMRFAAPYLRRLLRRRRQRGKEDAARLNERMGFAGLPRPSGKMIWLHAASVGEAQSILILIDALLALSPANILVTTGTLTSANLMAQRLPPGVIHQFYPLDQPQWVARFLDHWRPDLALWTESEIWPNMLRGLVARQVPAVLLNARLSDRSFRRWRQLGGTLKQLLDSFGLIIAQTDADTDRFQQLGALHACTGGNLKYSAEPLPYDAAALDALRAATHGRPLWLYASTHAGEEELASRLHKALKIFLPRLLTVVAPRHPDRAAAIMEDLQKTGLTIRQRSMDHQLPLENDDIYLADTLGELGLLYRLAPLACIGRSFSEDGGGGHNPLEAARLGCAVLHGPQVQNLAAIYTDMDHAGAAIPLASAKAFEDKLRTLLLDPEELENLRAAGTAYAGAQNAVLEKILAELKPWLQEAGIINTPAESLIS